MAGFPKFRDFRPDDPGFTCIHPCKSKDGQRCAHKVNQNDRKAAIGLRAKAFRPNADGVSLLQDLKQYAQLCFCVRVHRARAIKLNTQDEVALQWLGELVGQAVASSVVGTNTRVLPRFLRYVPSGSTDNLRHVISEPLSKEEDRIGTATVYMFRRCEDQGLVKIGITRKTADARFLSFTSDCGFEPIPLRQIRHVPYARRAERLIHSELQPYRRECTTCTKRAECGSVHSEWFEIDEDLAHDIMGKWARWMIYADPFDVHGNLKMIWLKHVESRGQLLSSDTITEAWRAQEAREEAQQAREDALVRLFSNMRLGKKLLTLSDAT